jgi:hypothetical protein
VTGGEAIVDVGLGHDLPIGAWTRIIDLITEHIAWAPFAARRGAPVTHTEFEE